MKTAEEKARIVDALNLRKIGTAFDEKRIDAAACKYLEILYSDGAGCFRRNFYFLGRTLGAPKTPIYAYDSGTGTISEKETEISEVGPNGSYIVHHRFDNDPMRNQFFTFFGTDVRLFVSSIVSVIVAAQKNVGRAIDKIAGKYYDDYLDEILSVVGKVLARHKKSASVSAISEKITDAFRTSFISNPSPAVLGIIGGMFPDISVELVRELDKVVPPHMRLRDVYRMKLLFDTVPQINAFIDYVRRAMPDKFMFAKNKFYDLENDRTYRDAKMIVLANVGGQNIPLEIIMNVRTFFNTERQSHAGYESIREDKKNAVRRVNELHHEGIQAYNKIICQAVQYLMHRVGWNIMYEKENSDSFFRGFPEIKGLPYSEKIAQTILDKMDNSVRNEVFRIPYAPRPLSKQEEISVFRYMTRFILFSALPYSYKYEEIKNMGFSGKVFNFVMKELYRYYENDVL